MLAARDVGVTDSESAGHERIASDRATDLRDQRTTHVDVEFDRSGVVRRVRRLFNALNYVDRRGADSTDWAD
jgi:hypothetical protein